VDNTSLQERIARVEELLAAITEHGHPVVRASAVELVRVLLELHRTGLATILQHVDGLGTPRQGLLDAFVADPVVSRLLLLHGLHPVDLPTRLRQALEHVRPVLVMHGATADILDVRADTVRLGLEGDRPGVRKLLEEAILEAAPEVLRLEFVEGVEDASARMPLPLVAEA
jgi:hypothetical protein